MLRADSPEAELGPWKAVGKLRLPAPAVGISLSEDKRRVVAMVLNDSKTIVYRDVKTGAKIKTPAAEVSKFPGAVRVLAVSSDRRLAVTTTLQPSENCTIWQRDVVKKK